MSKKFKHKPTINDFGQKVFDTQGDCPRCNDSNIDYGAIVPEGDGIYYPATCNDCGLKFRENYLLNFLETTLEDV